MTVTALGCRRWRDSVPEPVLYSQINGAASTPDLPDSIGPLSRLPLLVLGLSAILWPARGLGEDLSRPWPSFGVWLWKP